VSSWQWNRLPDGRLLLQLQLLHFVTHLLLTCSFSTGFGLYVKCSFLAQTGNVAITWIQGPLSCLLQLQLLHHLQVQLLHYTTLSVNCSLCISWVCVPLAASCLKWVVGQTTWRGTRTPTTSASSVASQGTGPKAAQGSCQMAK